tara:strand:+ start:13827 stop:14732 length:906 start_codon:yes stop_codon:yes gene_type:complete
MTQILGIVQDGKLIPEETWKQLVSGIENGFDNLETNLERAKRDLSSKFVEAVKKRASGHFGIMFSGGIDSTLIAFIAKKLGAKFTCYSVGMENSEDLKWAQQIAKEYGFHLKFKVLTESDFESVIKETMNIIKEPDVTKITVGAVGLAASKIAKEDGINVLFSGLGSEEIFAGYKRHEEALNGKNYEALHKECWNGMKGMWARDLVRDYKIGSSLGVSLMTPFLDKDVIKSAMGIHPMFKIDEKFKKVVLRYTAESLGLKKDFAWRKKKAAQYGSDFTKGLDKLASKNGFKFKKEYLASLL